jgi:hypothetical protein
MLELRRFLAEDLSRTAIHRMRDETVIELLAEQYLRGSLSIVDVRPPELNLEGFTVEGGQTSPVLGPTNKAGDLKPAPEVPPAYPILARAESDSVVDATLKLVAKLSTLLFSTFGFDKRPSTIAQQYKSTGEEESTGINAARNAMDAVLGSRLHAGGSPSKPIANVPDAYVAAATLIKTGPPAAIPDLVRGLLNLATVPDKNTRSADDPQAAKGPKFSDPKWSVDRVKVGQEVVVTFGYSGLEAGRNVTVSFFECNADGSRRRIAQEMVKVNAESGEGKVTWKRDPETAKADVANDAATGDTGPVEYRFKVEVWGAAPSDESGPLWLTNTVTLNLGGDDNAPDKPSVVVVLADHEKEQRVLSKGGKATFDNVLVGPLKVWIENVKVSSLTWNKSTAPVDEPVEASFSYEKAMAGMNVAIAVQDGTGRVLKQIPATLESESGQATVSFTRTEAEALEDFELVEGDEETGALEYRFVVIAGGAESEPSSPLHLTHQVVLPVQDFTDGEPLPDDMEPVLVDAEGTEHRGKISGEDATFEEVVWGPTTLKLEPKQA